MIFPFKSDLINGVFDDDLILVDLPQKFYVIFDKNNLIVNLLS